MPEGEIDEVKDDFCRKWYGRHKATMDATARNPHAPLTMSMQFLGLSQRRFLFCAIFCLALQLAIPVNAQDVGNADVHERILVRRQLLKGEASTALKLRDGRTLQRLRGDANTFDVLVVPNGIDSTALLRELNARSDVDFAVLDRRRRLHAVPTDTYFTSQWYLQDNVAQPSAIAADTAWDTNTGSSGIVVAVLDSGVRFDHPDLYPSGMSGKLLPGFDFVSNTIMANDGDGWDSDASDPGDWISQADLNRSDNFFDDCGDGPAKDQPTQSSWHGTKVAGMIAARSNNGTGIAGVSWGAYILPVRVMGKCGGHDGDIIDGMRWAAGLPVNGAPLNPYPAKIINMSLGSPGPCSAAYQSVIAQLAQIGVAVVVSAGNDGGPVNEPANCPGAIAVTGIRHAGTKVGFSSLGPQIALAAPGGNCVNDVRFGAPCQYSLVTTTNTGATIPGTSTYTDAYNYNVGTSFSAPLVSGVAALMRSANDTLSVAQLRARLLAGAGTVPFPVEPTAPTCRVPSGPNDLQTSECNCTTSTCGAGMLNAAAALVEAYRPIAIIAAPTLISAGATLSLDGASSSAACGRTVANFNWSVVSATGTASPVISNDAEAIATVNAPATGSFTLRLTVTDDQGALDIADITITPTSAATTSSAPSSSPACPIAVVPPVSQPIPDPTPTTVSIPTQSRSGGGGGALTAWLLGLLNTLAFVRMRICYLSNSLASVLRY